MIDMEALLRKIERQDNKLWQSLQDWIRKAPDDLRRFAEWLEEHFGELEFENELRNKGEVYLAVARFLHADMKQPLTACVGAVHALCGEQEPRLIDVGAVRINEVISAARARIVGIKVHYEQRDSRTWQRRVEVYYVRDGKPNVSSTQDQLPWDNLPGDVRRERLFGGRKSVSFSLFPRKET